MAKAKVHAVRKVEWQGYLRVNLTKEQEAAFDLWFKEADIQIGNLGNMANAGYKFSCSWDDFHDGVSASFFAASPKLAWSGWSLTAWAQSVEEAVGLLFYKHYVVCDQDWEHFKDVVERTHSTRG
jgi:hypothetical protein